jgi:site-specific recombinase XerD
VRHYSPKTVAAYVAWIRRFIVFYDRRHPLAMGGGEVAAFLSSLAVDGDVSASTQNQALAALLFLYREVLERELVMTGLVHAKRPARLPVVMTRAEVASVPSCLQGVEHLMASLLYGAGLRLLECATLRVKDVDLGAGQLIVRRAKGQVRPLPERLLPEHR